MRKTIIPHFYASLAVLTVSCVPVSISAADFQDEAAPEAEAPGEDARQSIIDNWPDQRRVAYDRWPQETKGYYWTLTKGRQKLFWGLADPDKVTLSKMNEEDRAKIWARLEAQGSAVL